MNGWISRGAGFTMGEIYASFCALAWALAVILFRRSGETMAPLALNLFRVASSSVLFLGTLAIRGEGLWGRAPLADYLVLAASAVIAIAVADTFFHACLNRVGAGIEAVVSTLYSPLVAFYAFLLLGERLDAWQWSGMFLVVGSVVLATRVQPPVGATRRSLIVGVLMGVAAMASLAFGIVLAKPVLEHSDVLWATTVRQLASLLVLVPASLIRTGRRATGRIFVPDRTWRFTLPGAILGSYLALLLWIGGMKYTKAGTAAILNQTSTIYILILAALVLKERMTRRKVGAAAMAVAGVCLVLRPWTSW